MSNYYETNKLHFKAQNKDYVPIIKLISKRALVVNIGNDTDISTIPDSDLWADDIWTSVVTAHKFSSTTVCASIFIGL